MEGSSATDDNDQSEGNEHTRDLGRKQSVQIGAQNDRRGSCRPQ